jgi:hypothetical protein
MNIAETRTSSSRAVSIAAGVGFFVVAAFQLALAVGLPLGHAAYGGAHRHLAAGYRVTSAFAMVFWIGAALVVLRRGGLISRPLSARFAYRAMWVLVVLSTLAALVNLASRSGWERFGWGPFSVIVAVMCFIVARSPTQPDQKGP